MSVEPDTCSEPGFVAPRVKKGILTLTAENTLNVGESTAKSSKKRKWSPITLEDLLDEPFLIKVGFELQCRSVPIMAYAHHSPRQQTLPSSSPGEVKKLTPKLLLPRRHLPLSFLDPIKVSTAVPTARLFSANVPALECEGPGSPQHTLAMVAEMEPEGSLYVVERVQSGLYALCKLGKWVNMEDLGTVALVAKTSAAPTLDKSLNATGSKSWWQCAATSPFDAGEGPRAKKFKANTSDLVQLRMRSSRSQTSTEPSQCSNGTVLYEPEAVTTAAQLHTSGTVSCEQDCGIALSAEELLDTMRCQYLEALYLSKTSLAYFVKGPLSRLRANFMTEHGAPTATSDLPEFLRSSVLTLAVFDKKYREAIPQIIQSLPLGNLSNDEDNIGEDNIGFLGTNKRKNKKKRLGKDGLYPREDDYIRQWWRSRELCSHNTGPNEDRDEESKGLIVELRTRETQMQLVLVLEVMALEASFEEVIDHDPLCEKTAQVRVEEISQAKKRRSKAPHDLNLLLELLIDRLTIWQSVSLPEEISRPSTSTGTNHTQEHVRMGHKGMSSATHGNNERLRDFCVEVIVPFYAARLPGTCSTVNERLGGVKIPSPVRPPLLKSASASQGLLRPGTVIDRNINSQPRKTLEHQSAFKKPFARRQEPPSLLRRATAPALSGLKRESSEVSLSDIPLKRSSVEKSKRYSQREVDLSAISNATEAKLRRKASIEEELRGAIATLKKPNRSLAIKEMNEPFEQRLSGAGSSSRKPKNPIRNPFGQGVLVMATPKGNRRKNVFGTAPLVADDPSPDIGEVPHPIPSIEPHIPSSVTRPTTIRRLSSSEFRVPQNPIGPVRQTLLSSVLQTPTRGPSKSIDALAKPQPNREEDELCLEMSPRPPRPKPFQTPRRASKRECGTSLSVTAIPSSIQPQESPAEPVQTSAFDFSLSIGVAATPVKHVRNSFAGSGSAEEHQKPTTESFTVEEPGTIYDRLGWDDDADDLL